MDFHGIPNHGAIMGDYLFEIMYSLG